MIFDIRLCCPSKIQSTLVCDVVKAEYSTHVLPANDVSKNSFNITRIRKVMAGAHEVLTAAALTRSRILISKARGEYTSLRSSHNRTREDDHQSILGSVMGVTQEVIEFVMGCALACLIFSS